MRTGTREIDQNLSVHINATKRLVMEKIQVELTNSDTRDNDDPEPCEFQSHFMHNFFFLIQLVQDNF